MEYDYTFDLHKVRIHLASDSLRIREEALMFLAAHQVGSRGKPDYELVFEESPAMPDVGVPELRTCTGHEGQVIEHNGQVFFSAAEGMACFDPSQKSCRGYIFPVLPGAGEPNGSVPLVHLLVARIMFAEGFLPLHGAAVDCQGQAWVLSGEKGAGKSTLALQFHRLGFPLICDDLLYLKRGASGLLAGAHSQAIKIKSQEAGLLPQNSQVAGGQARVPGKTLYPTTQFNPQGINRLYPVGAVIFLENPATRSATATVWLDRELEVFHRLLGDSPILNTPACRDRTLELLSSAGPCRFCLAKTSTDPDSTARQILRALHYA